jgi:site-specific recombinase XerD
MLMADSELALLSQEWVFSLKAKHLSPATIRSYTEAVRMLDEHLVASGVTEVAGIDRQHIEKFFISQSERVSSGSVLTRFRSLRVFFNWLLDTDEIAVSPMARMKEPRSTQRPPDVPDDDEVRRLLRSLEGKSFNDRRDLALFRFLFDTGARIGEAIGLGVDDVNESKLIATVRGKGDKLRPVPIGNRTAQALLAYRRERRKHRYANSPMLFLGQRGPVTYHAAYHIVRDRAAAVGLRLHPHQTRHWLAHTWLRDGGTEGGLRAVGGWDSNTVMNRYGKSAAAERARGEHKRLSPGDSL